MGGINVNKERNPPDAVPTHRGRRRDSGGRGETRSGMVPRGSRVPLAVNLFKFPVLLGRGKQIPAPGWDNLHVDAVSRHSLDRFNMSNDFKK